MKTRVPPKDDPQLNEVRSTLQEMGYLSHGVERFLLQDVHKKKTSWRAILTLAGKLGLLAGLPLALVGTFLVALNNQLLEHEPFDLIPLFFHLVVPALFFSASVFLILSLFEVLLLRLQAGQRMERLSFVVAAVGGVGATAFLYQSSLGRGRGTLALTVLCVFCVYFLIRIFHQGLLALAIHLTDRAPRRRLPRRWLVIVVATATTLAFAAPVILSLNLEEDSSTLQLPMTSGEKVLVVGVDGILPEETDYLLAGEDFPRLTQLVRRSMSNYHRPSGTPAAFWTSVATGRTAEEHGVVGVDAFRPLGLHRALVTEGILRTYWAKIQTPLGLARHEPLLASRREAPTFWELLDRAGRPSVAINWWSTFPASSKSGLVLAHGGYSLLHHQTPGAMESREEQPWGRWDQEIDLRAEKSILLAGGVAQQEYLLAQILRPDAFSEVVLGASTKALNPRAAAIYFPALDLLESREILPDLTRADLIRGQMGRIERLLAESADHFDTFVVFFDSGRRGSREGRLLFHRDGCQAPSQVDPLQAASAVFRLLGLPQSAELSSPYEECEWPQPPDRVPTFGAVNRTPQEVGGEYLEELRALGYL